MVAVYHTVCAHVGGPEIGGVLWPRPFGMWGVVDPIVNTVLPTLVIVLNFVAEGHIVDMGSQNFWDDAVPPPLAFFDPGAQYRGIFRYFLNNVTESII